MPVPTKTRADILKESLEKFYSKKGMLDKFNKVVFERTSGYSLRIIEWFCNNYSKKYDIIYKIPKTSKEFNVYLSYKCQLDSYSKKQFDPFNRKHKGFDPFEITIDKKNVSTTVGQLNFFKWCISNWVLDYIHLHLEDIKKDMLEHSGNKTPSQTTKKVNNKRVKRQPLSLNKTSIRRDTSNVLSF